jgi:L-ascorbate metabolism protein UlaG (beta-lactamase superfamily)
MYVNIFVTMDIYWGGQALFKIKGKSATAIIDPFDPGTVGLKLPKDLEADVALKTHDHPDHNNLAAVTGNPLQITGPGEYEIKGIAIVGIQVYHDSQKGEERGKNTIYNLEIDGLNIVHLGDLGHVLSDDQVQEVGNVDILMVPVGGTYTIDAKLASEVVSQLEPRIILPMHYGIPGLKYELEPVDNFLKEMGVESPTPQAKLSITKDKLPEEPAVILLNKV